MPAHFAPLPIRWVLLIVALLTLSACAATPRGVKRNSYETHFEPSKIRNSDLQSDKSQEISQDIPNIPLANSGQRTIQENALFDFALTLLANQNLNSPNLRYISYRFSCLQRASPTTAFFAFVLPSDEIPAFPYIIASVEFLFGDGRAILESDHVQAGWPQLDEPTFDYPLPVLLQDALTISDQYGIQAIEETLGEQCEIRALLSSNTWQLSWYQSDSDSEISTFAMIIDALTGDVIAAQLPAEN